MSLALFAQINAAVVAAGLPVAARFVPRTVEDDSKIVFDRANGAHMPLFLLIGADVDGPCVTVLREVLGSFGDQAPMEELGVYRADEENSVVADTVGHLGFFLQA